MFVTEGDTDSDNVMHASVGSRRAICRKDGAPDVTTECIAAEDARKQIGELTSPIAFWHPRSQWKKWKKWTNYTDHGLTHGMQQHQPEVSAAAGVVERGPTPDNFSDSHIVARAKFACISDPIIV